ncbi:unnamed protein product [Parajaminaea phylloscopi]
MAAVSASTASAPPATYGPRPAAPLKSKTAHRIDLANLTPNNIGQFRKLNSVLFPVRYSETFYKQALKEERKAVCKLALFNDIPVGNVCCKFEYSWPDASSSSSSSSSLLPTVNVYIMTLGVLAPYRHLGIGKRLVSHLVEAAGPNVELDLPNPDETIQQQQREQQQQAAKKAKDSKDQSKAAAAASIPTKKFRVESIYLHVQTNNDDARAFYKAQGFVEEETISEYYRQGVEPRSAVVLVKRQ